MITLQKFIDMYEPEIAGSFNIVLKTTITVGNITQTVRMGSYTITDQKCKELDMNRITVEKFSKSNSKDCDLVIHVSDNSSFNIRDHSYPRAVPTKN